MHPFDGSGQCGRRGCICDPSRGQGPLNYSVSVEEPTAAEAVIPAYDGHTAAKEFAKSFKLEDGVVVFVELNGKATMYRVRINKTAIRDPVFLCLMN